MRDSVYDGKELMAVLDGANEETVRRVASEEGSLPVRIAMLNLATARKQSTSLWYSYPPGAFIGYKRAGAAIQALVVNLADHLRARGLKPFLDVQSLDEAADSYFEIPQFISSLQDCTYYVLLLTERTADYITARHHKTSWIFDEYQYATNLVNGGRLVLIPLLLEPNGHTDFFTVDNVIDLTANNRRFETLDAVLPTTAVSLSGPDVAELARISEQFDLLFLSERFDQAARILVDGATLEQAFDYQFRQMLLALYSADGAAFEQSFDRLGRQYGQGTVLHLYAGYCGQHGIPVRISVP